MEQHSDYDAFHREANDRQEREAATAVPVSQNNGFNGFHNNGYDIHQNTRPNYAVHENYYNSVPSDYYMYRPTQNYSPFLRQEQSAYVNSGPSLGRIGSSTSSQGMSSSQSTYDSRDAFKALLPNVNVSFVSSPTGMSSSADNRNCYLSDAHNLELQNLFSSSPSSYSQSTNQYAQDNYRGLSDLGYQPVQRQQSNYEMNGGRQMSSISGMKWMVSPPPGFDNSRNQGQG